MTETSSLSTASLTQSSHQTLASTCPSQQATLRKMDIADPKNSSPTSAPDYIQVSQEDLEHSFNDIWVDAVSDHRLTLFGFKRFRTSHLVNLRYLALEIEKVDHAIFQAGLQLNTAPSQKDRLGLQYVKKNSEAPKKAEIINYDMILHLRRLLKAYGLRSSSYQASTILTVFADDALLAFNSLMSMETFALADNTSKASRIRGIHPNEKFKTRLLRVDLPLRKASRDPIQHYLRKGLRRCWFFLNKTRLTDEEDRAPGRTAVLDPSWERTWGNTARVAEILTRFVIALIAGATLVTPLAILSGQSSANGRLLVVVICIIIFSFVVSVFSKATNCEAMAVSAAYAAVMSVFLSNNQVQQ